MRGRASISAFALTILVLVLFLGPLTALAIAFARQAAELAGRLQVWIGQQQGTASRNSTRFRSSARVLDWLDQNLQISTTHVQAWLVEGSKRLFEQLARFGGIAFLGAVGTVLSFTVMLFMLFFIIRDGRADRAARRDARAAAAGPARGARRPACPRSRAPSCAARC